ncbi:hypothetical protein [Sinomicrobium soli]|uniref:hypothetical protein n=1 Tax=Sinomicrobium sp. N-1-3-6 TaxID=2219864 RepID=UPI000DCDA59E|nr:hypothetical protein [Sinomicrobium sp. N-1-3-6]RAV29606.1 hypothetical protein DN748_08375 [Sinomicrobium sp. N-1-3-6]
MWKYKQNDVVIPEVTNTEALFEQVTEEGLWEKLVVQIGKDFQSAGIAFYPQAGAAPEKLARDLHETLYLLLTERFNDYLSLLYIVDVPEKEVKAIKALDTVDISAEVCFLVLRREWQKVWLKNRL